MPNGGIQGDYNDMIITDWLVNIPTWVKFSRGVVTLVNRHSQRRAFMIFNKSRTRVRVVDDAVPIYDGGGKIIDWVRP